MSGYSLVGDPGAEIPTRLRRHAAVLGLALLESPTEEPSASTPQILCGSGVPSVSAPNGSFAFRLDAPDATSAIFARIGGAWVAVGAGAGGGGWADFPDLDQAAFATSGDAIASPPDGYAWDQADIHPAGGAEIDSATFGAGNVLDVDLSVTNTSARTGPRLVKTLSPHPGLFACVSGFFSSADLDASTEAMGLVVETATATDDTYLLIRNSGGSYQIQILRGTTSVATIPLVEDNVRDGIWLMIWQLPTSHNQLTWAFAYQLGGDADNPPDADSWTAVQANADVNTGGPMANIKVGLVMKTANTSGTFTGKCEDLWAGHI